MTNETFIPKEVQSWVESASAPNLPIDSNSTIPSAMSDDGAALVIREAFENYKDATFIAAFNAMADKVHDIAVSKDWWSQRDELIAVCSAHSPELGKFAELLNASNLICLEHSELSEGLEGLRKNLMDDKIPEFTMEEAEAADCVIRIMDRSKARKLRLAEAILAKVSMNEGRPIRHGGKLF